MSTSAIARRLVISVTTVRNHTQNILTKLGVHSRVAAVAFAVRSGLVDQSPGQGTR
jgi:two-component system nitrate/nitrite response regulator NarL